DPVFIANSEEDMKDAKKQLDALGIFKADLVSFTRYYEFMSQIVDYDSTDLEKLSLYARHLAPLLREKAPDDDPIDLSSVALSHYRLSKIKQQDLLLEKDGQEGLMPGTDVGTRKARNKEEELLSQIIQRLNELFVTDGLSEKDLVNNLFTVVDKVIENSSVVEQARKNPRDKVMLGDFPRAVDDAVMDSHEAQKNLKFQYLNSKEIQVGLQELVYDLLMIKLAEKDGSERVY
ncbi:type I restriction endonuclease subunit R, partial [bacterium]|nr:type I restriction endonuclease subunit R [bacterium]